MSMGDDQHMRYHIPYSMVAVCDGVSFTAGFNYQCFRQTRWWEYRNNCYAYQQAQIEMPRDVDMVDVEGIYQSDALLLLASEQGLYIRLQGDLRKIEELIMSGLSCCEKAMIHRIGSCRYQIVKDRLESIRSLLEWIISSM